MKKNTSVYRRIFAKPGNVLRENVYNTRILGLPRNPKSFKFKTLFNVERGVWIIKIVGKAQKSLSFCTRKTMKNYEV